MKPMRILAVASTLAAVVPAQLTISDGNMNVVVGALSTVQEPQSLELRADALGTNHGYEQGWFYRVAGDTREYALRSVGVISEGVVAGKHADRDFANVDIRSQLKASVDWDVYDSGPASGVVINRLTLTNRSQQPVTVDVFCYTDLDIAGTPGNDVCVGTNSSHFVSDPSGIQIEVRAIGNDLSQVGAWPSVRDLLTNATLDDLSGALPPFTGDYTGAFQWQNRTLQPFEQKTFTVALAVETSALALPLVENYGTQNGTGFEIHTSELPLQDNTQPRMFACRMKGALRFVEYRTIVGLTSSAPFPFIPGLDFWVLPGSVFAVYGGITSQDGEASNSFVVPASPYFSGISVYFQVFSVDASAPNGYAYQSAGMHVTIGKL
jgi:hypothetical protein